MMKTAMISTLLLLVLLTAVDSVIWRYKSPYIKVTVAGETFQLSRKYLTRENKDSAELYLMREDITPSVIPARRTNNDWGLDTLHVTLFQDGKWLHYLPEHLIKNKDMSSQKLSGMTYLGSERRQTSVRHEVAVYYVDYFMIDHENVSRASCSRGYNGEIDVCRVNFKLDDKVVIDIETNEKNFFMLPQTIKNIKQLLSDARIKN
jgi:hypothetical protein